MKRNLWMSLAVLFFTPVLFGQKLKPYILGAKSDKSIATVKTELKEKLAAHNFKILGEYQPAQDANRWLIVVTSDNLLSAVSKVGNLTGFAASLRIALTKENDKVLISYTNPEYWGNAYFRDDFDKVSTFYTSVSKNLTSIMKSTGTYAGTAFGSEEGIEVNKLHKYHYMFGMPYFDDTVELGTFSSFDEAVKKIEANLSNGIQNVQKVYSVEIPGKNLKLYGFALSGEDGESHFLPIIDIGNPKHTAFLPYEFLVKDNEVHMLHGRFRIALSFPDLTMGTFTKIMSTPGNIEDMLESVVK